SVSPGVTTPPGLTANVACTLSPTPAAPPAWPLKLAPAAPDPPIAVMVMLVALVGTTQADSPVVVNGEGQPTAGSGVGGRPTPPTRASATRLAARTIRNARARPPAARARPIARMARPGVPSPVAPTSSASDGEPGRRLGRRGAGVDCRALAAIAFS